MQSVNEAQKGTAISMILPRCPDPPVRSVSAKHLAALFFAAYNPLPWAVRGFSGPLTRRHKWQLPTLSGRGAGSAGRPGGIRGGFPPQPFSWA